VAKVPEYLIHAKIEEHRGEISTLGQASPHDTTCGSVWTERRLKCSVFEVEWYDFHQVRWEAKEGYLVTKAPGPYSVKGFSHIQEN
jgi:hypothetical protein